VLQASLLVNSSTSSFRLFTQCLVWTTSARLLSWNSHIYSFSVYMLEMLFGRNSSTAQFVDVSLS
jgi:hypothetical protein